MDRREPVLVLGDLAGDHVEEEFLDLGRDRSARALAYGAPVELADGRDLGRGAGEEGFVGDIDVVASEAPGNDFIAQLVREGDDRGARDPAQGGSQLRLVDLAALADEEIPARSLTYDAGHAL